jgi:hypothetical protein
VVGNDSVVYNKTFLYKISVSVSTVVGNGRGESKYGTLAESQLKPKFLAVDKEGNIFVAIANAGSWGMIRINEKEDICVPLATSPTDNAWNCQCPSVDPFTGVVTSADNANAGMFYKFDPKEGWAPRIKNWVWKEGTQIPINPWKKNMPTSPLDSCIYVRRRKQYLCVGYERYEFYHAYRLQRRWT